MTPAELRARAEAFREAGRWAEAARMRMPARHAWHVNELATAFADAADLAEQQAAAEERAARSLMSED